MMYKLHFAVESMKLKKKKKRNFVINDSNLIIIENSAEAAPYMMEP